MTVFRDREEAGEKLAERLHEGEMVLAIPRGGVVVGKVVADKLGLPLQVVVTKKIGAPGQEELAVGAMAEEGQPVIDETLVARLGGSKGYLVAEKRRVRQELCG